MTINILTRGHQRQGSLTIQLELAGRSTWVCVNNKHPKFEVLYSTAKDRLSTPTSKPIICIIYIWNYFRMYVCVYLPSLVDGLAPSTSGCSLNYGQDRLWIPWCVAFDPMCFCGGGQKLILFGVVKDHQTGLGRSHVFTVDLNMKHVTTFINNPMICWSVDTSIMDWWIRPISQSAMVVPWKSSQPV